MTGILYPHWSQVPKDIWRWPNFGPGELTMNRRQLALACPCCGEFYLDFEMMDSIQLARNIYGEALYINSGHRCTVHNANVGGALLSEHLKVAWDVSTRGKDPVRVLNALQRAGFTTFGLYNTFIHTDLRPGRAWYGKGAQKTWNGLIPSLASLRAGQLVGSSA